MLSGNNSPLGAAIREAVAVQREFRGFIWYNAFRDNLTQMGVLFAVLLGCGGLLSEAKKGSALFTLSLPITRRELLKVRTVTGLTQCLAITMIPPLVIPIFAPAIGQQFSPIDALAHGLCLFFVAALFFSLASFLRPCSRHLAAAADRGVHGLHRGRRAIRRARVGLVQGDERRNLLQDGCAPVDGFLTTAVLASVLLYSAAETLERRDF